VATGWQLVSRNVYVSSLFKDQKMEARQTVKDSAAQVITPAVIIERLRQEKPELLGKMNDRRVINIFRQALQQLAGEIEGVSEGAVRVPGLGNFTAKQVKAKGNDAPVRRVFFQPAKPKAIV